MMPLLAACTMYTTFSWFCRLVTQVVSVYSTTDDTTPPSMGDQDSCRPPPQHMTTSGCGGEGLHVSLVTWPGLTNTGCPLRGLIGCCAFTAVHANARATSKLATVAFNTMTVSSEQLIAVVLLVLRGCWLLVRPTADCG
ncbi:hypothetical protein COO60DRAFT_1496394 [Scenedesmus sp. NREL 46B-D3]|nr:hypothetical protein COO60DRAFT_1496394 [Scenedesmus sp. NREL 46B-D3]